MWLIIGLLLGAGITSAVWLRSKDVKIAWYEWLLSVSGILLILFTIENMRTSYAEFETLAASKFLLIFGLPGLVLFLLAVALVFWRFIRRKRLATQREPAK